MIAIFTARIQHMMVLPISLMSASRNGAHAGLIAAVERGPLYIPKPLLRGVQGCHLLRASRDHRFIVEPLFLTFLIKGGLIGLLLRASNEGLPIPHTSL